MIITLFLASVFGVLWLLTAPLRLLSDVVLPADIASAVTTANGYLSSFDEFLPISAIITILGLMFIIEIVIVGYRVVMWVLTKIPGISN